MIIISRKEAITLASFIRLYLLTKEERENLIKDVLDETGIKRTTSIKVNMILRKHIENIFKNYINSYIENFISNNFNCIVKIEDKDIKLNTCPCCGYNTLKQRGEYYVCVVCYWEDDGTSNEESYSTVNKLTLKEAKLNFNKFGVISEGLIKIAEVDRKSKYSLHVSSIL